MWISTILLRRHVPGRIFSGKHRVSMKVTKHQRKRSNESNLRIENNEQLLSYPYLTVYEEHSHAATRNNIEKTKCFDLVKRKRNLGNSAVYNAPSYKTLGLLQHLNVTKK